MQQRLWATYTELFFSGRNSRIAACGNEMRGKRRARARVQHSAWGCMGYCRERTGLGPLSTTLDWLTVCNQPPQPNRHRPRSSVSSMPSRVCQSTTSAKLYKPLPTPSRLEGDFVPHSTLALCATLYSRISGAALGSYGYGGHLLWRTRLHRSWSANKRVRARGELGYGRGSESEVRQLWGQPGAETPRWRIPTFMSVGGNMQANFSEENLGPRSNRASLCLTASLRQ